MLTLALDTSTPVGSIGVARDGEFLAETRLLVRATRSETVLPAIGRVLREHGHRPTDIAAVVVGGGPGSFTGVRIAASLAKGICHARGLPLYSYSSLAAVAAGTRAAIGNVPVCTLFDARRGEVYAAGYRVGEGLEEVFRPRAVALTDLLTELDPSEGWSFAGNGAGPGGAEIRGFGGAVLPEAVWHPTASALLWLASVDPEAGRVAEPATWVPAYGRLPAARRAAGGGP